jgi:hypothetical protein
MICSKCKQDHAVTLSCIASRPRPGARGKKVDPEKMRKAANARWKKYRAKKKQK